MKLNTENIEIEVEVDGVKVKGRLVGVSEQQQIREKNYVVYKRKVITEDTQEESFEEKVVIDSMAFGKELFVASIISMKGKPFTDDKDKPLPCTPEVLGGLFEFSNAFCMRVANKITSTIQGKKEGDKKN